MWCRPNFVTRMTVFAFSRSRPEVHKNVWRLQPKFGGYVPFYGGGGAGSPSNTMGWPTSAPSGILVHPAVWPQYTGLKVGAAVPSFDRPRGTPPLGELKLNTRGVAKCSDFVPIDVYIAEAVQDWR